MNRAVSFEGDLKLLYEANLKLRTALRVLIPISEFEAWGNEQFYRNVRDVNWADYLLAKETFAVDSFVSSKHFNHSKFVALKTKDAIVDQFRDKFGRRPSVDVENPALRLNVHIAEERCTISLDSSADSLHKRGYRQHKTEAPLSEVLAAGMILLSGWDSEKPFVDPMCGSGTLLVEAGLIATNRAPSLLRKKYGFMNWRNFDEELWKKIRTQAESEICEPRSEVVGSDKSPRAVKITEENIRNAGLENAVTVKCQPFERFTRPEEPGVLITNPPYGERMDKQDVSHIYRTLGDILKQNYTGFDAWVLSANKEALKQIGLRPSEKKTLFNGGLECKFQKFSLYEGSVKSKYQS